MKTGKQRIVWYAKGGGISMCGPFKTQIEAVNSMRLAEDIKERSGSVFPFPPDVFVWPEVVR